MSLELIEWPVQGEELPLNHVEPTTIQLFLYSAVTWNPHRIHYDLHYAQTDEGYDGVLVQGPLLGGWLLSTAQQWFRSLGHIDFMTHRSVATAIPGEKLSIKGKVSEITDDTAVIVMQIAKQDESTVCQGTVHITKRD